MNEIEQSMRNERTISWLINCELNVGEQEAVDETTRTIVKLMKVNGLSHIQAIKALEYAKVVLNEQPV